MRLSYDFLEPIDEILECVPVPKEQGGKKTFRARTGKQL